MLKKILSFIFTATLSINYAYNQEIKISKIDFIHPINIQKQSGLNFEITTFLSDSAKQRTNFYPQLKYWIEFKDRTIFTKQTSLDYFYDDSLISQYFTPFEAIKLKIGKYKLTIKAFAFQDNQILSDTFSMNFTFFQPQLYDYQEQRITIQRLNVQTTQYYGSAGLLYEAQLKFRFPSAYIKGISQDEQKAYYYIEPEIIHLEYVQILDFASVIKFRKRIAIPINHLEQRVVIFVPFSEINLPTQQEYFISAGIKLSDKTENWNFTPAKRIGYRFYFPTLRYFYISVSNINIAYATDYDPQSTLGQLFFKAAKNKGKGYPDPYWQLKQGNIVIFRSANFSNEFTAPNGKNEFKVASGDKLVLQVLDYDAIGEDDLIGEKEINTLENDLENINLKMGNVKKLHLVSQTKLYPKIKSLQLNYIPEQQAGISGWRVVPEESFFQDNFFKISTKLSIDTLTFDLDSSVASIFIPYINSKKNMEFLLHYKVYPGNYHFTIKKIVKLR